MSELDSLSRLSDSERAFLQVECGEAIAALEEGRRGKSKMNFSEYVEYLTLREFIQIAQEGYPIVTEEVMLCLEETGLRVTLVK